MTHGPIVAGVTTSQANLWARSDVAATVDFEYSTAANLSGSVISSSIVTASGSDFTAQATVTGLSANTVYYYTPRVDSVRALSSPYATFKTAMTIGTDAAFKFGYITDFTLPLTSTPAVYVTVDNEAPDFVYIGGDIDHRDPQTAATIRTMHKENRDSAQTGRDTFVTNIFRKYWVDHSWDDHDYGVNNGDKTLSTKALSLQGFKEYWPLNLNSPSLGIWHNFSYANADFIVLDSRYQRDTNTDTDNADKSLLDGDNLGSTGQLQWLKNTLAASTARWKFIMTETPWHTDLGMKPQDSWVTYSTERNDIINYIKSNNIHGVVFLHGDVHAGAIDTGVNTAFWTMMIPKADPGTPYCDTTQGNWGVYNKGTYGQGADAGTNCNGYGLIEILTNPHRVNLWVKDGNGNLALSGIILYERTGVSSRDVVSSRNNVSSRNTVSRANFN